MTPQGGRAVRMAYLVASVAGVLFFVMSVGLLGIWPARVLEEQSRAMSPLQPLAPSTRCTRCPIWPTPPWNR